MKGTETGRNGGRDGGKEGEGGRKGERDSSVVDQNTVVTTRQHLDNGGRHGSRLYHMKRGIKLSNKRQDVEESSSV